MNGCSNHFEEAPGCVLCYAHLQGRNDALLSELRRMTKLSEKRQDEVDSLTATLKMKSDHCEQTLLQNDELRKLIIRVYACHQPDVCDCEEPSDGPHSDSCISTRVANVALQKPIIEKRNCECPASQSKAITVNGCCPGCKLPIR